MPLPDILPARRADLGPLARLSRRLVEAGLAPAWTEERLERVLRSEEGQVLSLRRGHGVVGGAVLELEGSTAHLSLLVVDPQVQRQGLGRALLECCEQRAREAGCAQLRLEVREGNRQAIAFYRQCGYAQTHERAGYYGAKESALCFSRALP